MNADDPVDDLHCGNPHARCMRANCHCCESHRGNFRPDLITSTPMTPEQVRQRLRAEADHAEWLERTNAAWEAKQARDVA